MSTEIELVIFNRPESARKIELEIKPGMTIPELAEECTKHPQVTADFKEIMATSCIVDGKYWSPKSPQSVFTGQEKKVKFMEMVIGG